MNPLRGETTLEVGSKPYHVAFDWNAAAAYEGAASRSISDALRDIAAGTFSATSVRAMLWAGMRRHHADIRLEDVGRMMDQVGRAEALRVVREGMRYFFPELDESEADADPQTPAAST